MIASAPAIISAPSAAALVLPIIPLLDAVPRDDVIPAGLSALTSVEPALKSRLPINPL